MLDQCLQSTQTLCSQRRFTDPYSMCMHSDLTIFRNSLNLRNWYRHQYTWNRPLGLSMIRATTSDGGRVHAHERANTMLPSPGGSPNKHAHARSIDDGVRPA